MDDTFTIGISFAVFALAGMVKGIVGLGLPTVVMALLALSMSPAQAAALIIVPSLATNLWQLRPWTTLRQSIRRLWPMQLAVCLGTLGGAWWFGAPAGAWATGLLGAVLIAYGAWGLAGARPRLAQRHERWLGPCMGAASGLMTAATGVFTVPAVPYLQALDLARDDLIRAMALSFTVSTLALAIGLWFNGSLGASQWGLSTLMLLPAFAGMAAGQWLRQRLSPEVFRQCFLGSLVLLGMHMVAHAPWSRA